MAQDDRSDQLPTFDLEPPPVFEVSSPRMYQGEQPTGRISVDPGLAPVGLQPAQPAGQFSSFRPKRRIWPVFLVAGLLVLVGVAVALGAFIRSGGLFLQSEPVLQTHAPRLDGADFGDGTHLVGRDIAPGTYRTPVILTEDLTWGCYWYIMDAATPSKADHIAAGGTEGGRPMVTLEEGQYFQSDGCLGWALEPAGGPSAVTPDPLDALAEGVWLVGTDIVPGTYRSSSLLLFAHEWGYCYLAAHSDATWEYDAVVSSQSAGGGHPMITLEPGELVENLGCGTLTLVDVDSLRDNAMPSSIVMDGMWLVGVDVHSGTYRTVGTLSFEESYEACYASIYEGTRFADDDLIDIQRFTEGYAELRLRDGVMFRSDNCGTWERQGD